MRCRLRRHELTFTFATLTPEGIRLRYHGDPRDGDRGMARALITEITEDIGELSITDDTGAEYEGAPRGGTGSPAHEGSGTFWFSPPVGAQASQLRVTVSTLWEAAWALVDIPGR